jgi:prevent-host-death family protein
MTTLPLSEVKARLSEIAEEVDRTHERVHITRNGREYVVLLSAEDLSSLEATLELLSDPDAVARIRQAERDLATGDVTTAAEMADLMTQRRKREQHGA